MNYTKLFTVTCTHQYFGGGPCSDLQIVPTDACRKLLDRFRMLYKQEGTGTVSISRQQAESAGEIQMPLCTSPLTFYLMISNPAFYTYTKNVSQNKNNILLFTPNIKAAANKPDFTAKEQPKPVASGYVSNGSLFGALSVLPSENFRSYTLNLEAAAVKWQYYIVSNGGKILKVTGPSPEISFLPVADESRLRADKLYQALSQSRPEAKVFLYESEKPLAFAKKSPQKIQLLDTVNNTVMIENLPTPSTDENGLKVIVM